MATPVNDRTAKLTTDSDGLGVTENYRFCYEPWAKATGTEPPKTNHTNPANAELSGGPSGTSGGRPSGRERT